MRDMTCTFTVNSTEYDIANYNGVLQAYRFTPREPIFRFVEIPGRSEPIDISRAATGNMTYTNAKHEIDVAVVDSNLLSENLSLAQFLADAVNGNIAEVEVSGQTFTAEVACTKFEFVGEFVLLTFTCTEVSV